MSDINSPFTSQNGFDSTTATVTAIVFSDNTVQTTAATNFDLNTVTNQALFTTSSVQFNSLNATTTSTIAQAIIGLNNDARSFGNGFYPANANNMKIENPNAGAGFNFAMKNPSGTEKNVGISRQGNVVLQNGVFGNNGGSPGQGIGLSATDGGPGTLDTNYDDGSISYKFAQVGGNVTDGAYLFTEYYDYGTDTDYTYQLSLNFQGTATLPGALKFPDNSIQTTAYTGPFDLSTVTNQALFTTSSVQFNSLTATTTSTIAQATIGLNNGARSFGNGFYPANANNMKIENPNAGAGFNFAMKNPSGVEKNVGISRQGNVVLANGSLGNSGALGSGGGFSATDGGPATIDTSYDDGVTSFKLSQAGANVTDGAYLFTEYYDYGTDTDSTYQLKLDFTGQTTLPGPLQFADTTVQITAFTSTNAVTSITAGTGTHVSGSTGAVTVWTDGGGGTPGATNIYARDSLPGGTTGTIITVSDSGSDTNSPAGNWAPAYWDPDAGVWTYIGNSNSVTPI